MFMKLNFNELLTALSFGLDCVEKDLAGVATNHSKRVAYLCIKMGERLNLEQRELSDLASYAVMHDNALTEFIQAEYTTSANVRSAKSIKLGPHCSMGERNIKCFPFFKPVDNVILYHHENADGSGPFLKKTNEVHFYARLIHIADNVDSEFNLSCVDGDKFSKIIGYLKENEDRLFDKEDTELFKKCFVNASDLNLIDSAIDSMLKKALPYTEAELSPQRLIDIGSIFAKIIDYKSEFTSLHSLGIAKKAYEMGKYYGFDEEKCSKLYLAGAVHDVGKLAVNTDILEKPGKLTSDEFDHIKEHAYYSAKILEKLEGLEDVAKWAMRHHEKLNKKGYPFGIGADKLDHEDRLLACLDIYQALVEERPYKSGKTHSEAVSILYKMAADGMLDMEISKDIDRVFEGN